MAHCVRLLLHIAALEGSSQTGLCFRSDVGNSSIRLAYDMTPSWFQMRPPTAKTTRLRYVHDGPIRYGNDSACCCLALSLKRIATSLCHRRSKYQGLQSAVLG